MKFFVFLFFPFSLLAATIQPGGGVTSNQVYNIALGVATSGGIPSASGGIGTNTVIKGTATVDALASTNSINAGSNNVAPSGVTLNAEGHARITGTLSVTNALVLQGNAILNQNLNVAGTTATGGSINAGSNNVAPAGITLNAEGSARVTGVLSVSNAAVIQGNVIANQNVTVGGAISAASASFSSGNSVVFGNLFFATNAIGAAPDYNIPNSTFTTNANWAVLNPLHVAAGVSDTNYQGLTQFVTNSAASAITFTVPAGYVLQGTNGIRAGGVNKWRVERQPGVTSNLWSWQCR